MRGEGERDLHGHDVEVAPEGARVDPAHSRFRVGGAGFRVQGSGFRVQGLGCHAEAARAAHHATLLCRTVSARGRRGPKMLRGYAHLPFRPFRF